MADLRTVQDMSRTLYHHQWASLDEWVRSVNALADLDDDEIDDLVRRRTLAPEAAILT
ncbi:MAG: hypothetical protein IPM60_12905 [Rhodospirillales bacterium]|nr:hypothetical protein [Rhodospirillales bacterium]